MLSFSVGEFKLLCLLRQEKQGAVVKMSYQKIGTVTGLSSRSIVKAIRALEEKGIVKQIRPVNQSQPATYILCSLKEVDMAMEDKEKLLADLKNLRGGGILEEEEKPKKEKQTFKSKSIHKWNGNDLLYYFADRYRKVIGVPYTNFTGKERKLAKTLLENSEFSRLDIIKVIDFYIKNYKDVPGHPNDYPSWSIFWGWRSTIFPMGLLGAEPEKNRGKNKIREWNEEKGKEEWVPTSWD